jgi:hypothetical protein
MRKSRGMEILRPSALFSLMAAFGADPVVGQLGMLSSEAQTAISVPCSSFVFVGGNVPSLYGISSQSGDRKEFRTLLFSFIALKSDGTS